jgi:hypothetical protein
VVQQRPVNIDKVDPFHYKYLKIPMKFRPTQKALDWDHYPIIARFLVSKQFETLGENLVSMFVINL